MRLLAALFLSLAACSAAAADADYAVVSVIGDRFTVADRNTDVRREGHQGYSFPLGSASIDGAALAAVKQVVAERIPGAKVSLALIREPAVYEAEAEVLSLSRETQPLVEALQPVLGQIKARRLILVSKVREPVDVHFADVYKERPGVLEGLGFYIDPGMRIQNTQTLERSVGYIGVFAHFRVSVVNQETHRVMDEERVAEMKAFRDERKEPWESYSPEQKIALIKSTVAGQIRNVLPALLERTR